jgi:AcrR family transcriptional regulator
MSSPGLRERKKQKTRWLIQEHALRLFKAQGYDQTTVEQIAAAAEVSPSTFFRYFKTKEDVVIEDEFDPLLLGFVASAPASASPTGALRHAVREALALIDDDARAQILDRTRLMYGVPALRMRMLDNFLDQVALIAGALAARADLPADDPELVVLSGALTGAMIVALTAWQAQDGGDLAAIIDRALAVVDREAR